METESICLNTIIDEDDIEVFNKIAKTSTVYYSGTPDLFEPKDIENAMRFILKEEKTNIANKLNKDLKSINLNGIYLKNKYLYNLGDSTVSYLKAINSMKDLLKESIDDETDKAIELVNDIKRIENEKESKNENHYCYVSLGCGDGKKDAKICTKTGLFSIYFPIDINGNLIRIAMNEITKGNTNVKGFGGYLGDFTKLQTNSISISLPKETKMKKVFFSLGNTIGNYQESEILDSVYNVMGNDDYFIVSFEKYVADNEVRYKSSENTDFLLNPFKSIDYYSFARHRYVKGNWVQGLSDINMEVKSYLVTLGMPTHYLLSPLHIIWSNRYEKEHIVQYFNNNEKFILVKIVEDSKSNNILVLLQKSPLPDLYKDSLNKCKRIINFCKQKGHLTKAEKRKIAVILKGQDASIIQQIVTGVRTQEELMCINKLKEILKSYKI